MADFFENGWLVDRIPQGWGGETAASFNELRCLTEVRSIVILWFEKLWMDPVRFLLEKVT